ncbi:hypothetical protein RHMOL_Rhmol08G0109600 [Rhododendron molle]|uniref:Uncharacterized protein n=1 Tax=Rhododendron molle TaxID=49168 RepID=A0ACC0MNA5_RHOML|nr:hypothetical protein RHMOL_Rhmol08G0109600 [Rhododendron molle]
MHDIGGWYVETFGRDRKGRTVPSRRYWDGFDVDEQFDNFHFFQLKFYNIGRRLHPAIYLLALAYRTLDLEDAKRRKQSMKDIVEGKLSGIITWCKKLV